MEKPLYQRQMNRLAETFGATQYKPERLELIWREVKDLPEHWMTQTVDQFIGEFRQAPLLPEFREAVSRFREKTWSAEKDRHRRESEAAVKQIFDGEITTSICKTITDRIEGRVSDEIFTGFRKSIRTLGAASCSHCDDTGLISITADGYEYPHRCECSAGQRQSKHIPAYFNGQRGAPR